MWPKGQWCEETQFVSVVHDSCKGNGLVVGGTAFHSCAGIWIFPVSLLQGERHYLPVWLQPGDKSRGAGA